MWDAFTQSLKFFMENCLFMQSQLASIPQDFTRNNIIYERNIILPNMDGGLHIHSFIYTYAL